MKNTTKLKIRMVMIDLDGTLINTAPDLALAANLMLEELGMNQHPLDKIESWIGNGVATLVKRALTGEYDGEPDPGLFDKGYALFLKHYGEHVSDESKPYPGVVEGLDKLKETGFRLACITNKAEAFTVPLLKDLDLYDYFELVISGDSLPKKKPDPLPLLHACKHFGITPDHGLLVGDSDNDTQAAHNANMPVIIVPYGYNKGMDVSTLGAVAVIDSLAQLDQHIELF
ncbi:MAG: phosphoglycolate phosphatase [Gammaproteobacteria bacterium]|nr:MAG: phosphoglycolate phosphatase [Gammaproteobacteria bacterium]